MKIHEYPTRVHEKRVRGKTTDSDNCEFCKEFNITERDNTIHLLETCYIANTETAAQLRASILEQYSAATGRCQSSLELYFRLNPGAYTTFLLNPAHHSIPRTLKVTDHHNTSEFLNSLARYCKYIHNKRHNLKKSMDACIHAYHVI